MRNSYEKNRLGRAGALRTVGFGGLGLILGACGVSTRTNVQRTPIAPTLQAPTVVRKPGVSIVDKLGYSDRNFTEIIRRTNSSIAKLIDSGYGYLAMTTLTAIKADYIFKGSFVKTPDGRIAYVTVMHGLTESRNGPVVVDTSPVDQSQKLGGYVSIPEELFFSVKKLQDSSGIDGYAYAFMPDNISTVLQALSPSIIIPALRVIGLDGDQTYIYADSFTGDTITVQTPYSNENVIELENKVTTACVSQSGAGLLLANSHQYVAAMYGGTKSTPTPLDHQIVKGITCTSDAVFVSVTSLK